MSVSLSETVVKPTEDTYLEDAWELKERIRRRENIFKQEKDFFANAYRRATVFCYHDTTTGDIAGFAASRNDGYILFLAVSPDYRRKGLGRDLVNRIHQQFGQATLHVRTTNENAIGFYTHIGFTRLRKIPGYYEDDGDAYYLVRKRNDLAAEGGR